MKLTNLKLCVSVLYPNETQIVKETSCSFMRDYFLAGSSDFLRSYYVEISAPDHELFQHFAPVFSLDVDLPGLKGHRVRKLIDVFKKENCQN